MGPQVDKDALRAVIRKHACIGHYGKVFVAECLVKGADYDLMRAAFGPAQCRDSSSVWWIDETTALDAGITEDAGY